MMLDGFQCTNTPILASRSHCARAAYSLGVSWNGSTLPANTIQLRWRIAVVVIRNIFMLFCFKPAVQQCEPCTSFLHNVHFFSDDIRRESKWAPTPRWGVLGAGRRCPHSGGIGTATLVVRLRIMPRPVTSFTGQWAGFPPAEFAAKAKAMRCEGLEIMTSPLSIYYVGLKSVNARTRHINTRGYS